MAALAKNIMIGIFVIIAFAIIVFILLFLHPSVGDSAKTLYVRFTDIDKINIGTRVTYAGLAVGEVASIQEIPHARTGRVDHNGNVYIYELILKVDSGVEVFNTDQVSTRTSGLLGEKTVAIIPQPALPGQEIYLVENQVLYAMPAPSIEETLKKFGDIGKKVERMMDGINDTIDEFKREQVVTKIARSVQNVTNITDALNQPDKWKTTLDNIWTLSNRVNKSWTNVDSTLQNVYDLSHRAHNSWDTIDSSLQNVYGLTDRAHNSWDTIDSSLKKFNAAAANTQDFTGKIQQVVTNTSHGQGTIGRLFVSDDLYLRLKSVLSKGQTIMNDINHYGLLFHLNKGWQRLNARRLNLLEKLSDPQQFTTYFHDELDQISSSLSRVSMVLHETENAPCSLINDPNYMTQFADLIRRVEGIEEELKMYNEQVMDQVEYPRSP